MSNPFIFPYVGRIMARLPGHEAIELYRPKRGSPLYSTEITSYRRELDPVWEVWVERSTDPKLLLSSRPVVQEHQANNIGSTRLDGTELRKLEEENSLLPEFKA